MYRIVVSRLGHSFLFGLTALGMMSSASAAIIDDLAAATIIEEFLFNDASGTSYDAAANNINAGVLLSTDSDLAGVTTNGSALDASLKANDDFGSTIADTAGKALTGRYLGVMEVTWDFQSTLDPAQNEELRISLLDGGTSTVTAEFEIQREDDDTLTLLGNGVGTGASDIAPVVLNGGSLTQSSTFIAVVDADLTADTFEVHFSSDAGVSFTTLTGGVLNSDRGVDKLRMILNNDLSGDNILIDRIYLAKIPEPATLALFALGLIGLAAGRRRQ